ncbi:MAG: hypothetical protein U1F33_05835 [Alphaproteobacteria bacterium]
MGVHNHTGELARAADVLVKDHFCVQPDESILITADSATDPALIEAIMASASLAGAKPAVMIIPRLPFQGTLADSYVTDPLKAAVRHCDVWFDLTFPYLAGSHTYDNALREKRARYLLLGDTNGASLARLYGKIDFDRLFDVQSAIDRFFADSEGKTCRVTSPLGTDFTFSIGKPATQKTRFANQPGSQTVPGSAIMFPEPESVRGTVVLEATFHEYYTHLSSPITLNVDGKIQGVKNGGAEARVLDRALRRAGSGSYGYLIHFTYGFHPAAMFTGRSFIEDIRVVGHNAIGLGLPWWVPGGGENHPDGVVTNQSMWIDETQVVADGAFVYPHDIAQRAARLEPRYG